MVRCKRCGSCCKVLTLQMNNLSKDAKEFYLARGCKIIEPFIQIKHICPHLKDNKCDIHKNKPKFCRAFSCKTSISPFKY